MKITIIHGQNHKGSTYHIVQILLEQMKEINGKNDVMEFFLPKDLNHFCMGCYHCIKDDTACPYYEEKKKITDAVEQAELLIFTTPVYCLRTSAPMKSLLDFMFTYWMPHRPRACMFKKRAVILSTAAGSGTKPAMKDIATSLFYWGVPWIKSYGINVQAMNWSGVSAKRKDRIQKDMNKLAQKVITVKSPHVGIKTKLLFLMMSKMHKAGWDSDPIEKQYWLEHGWIGHKRPWKE